jgi:TonB family protein
MNILAMILLWSTLGSISVVGPAYPPNAASGGTVIAELRFAAGKVENLKMLSGEGGAFADSCREALAQWHRDSPADGEALVIVHFRQPYLYFWGNRKEAIRPAKVEGLLPYPTFIVQPAYPADAQAQGSVVLQLSISDEGNVTDVKTIQAVGALTSPSVEAVRDWKFKPAEDAQGNRKPSIAYAVLVYRYPVLAAPAK